MYFLTELVNTCLLTKRFRWIFCRKCHIREILGQLPTWFMIRLCCVLPLSCRREWITTLLRILSKH